MREFWQHCQTFGIETAGGTVKCSNFLELECIFEGKSYLIKWYIIEGVDLVHRWILCRGSLMKLGYVDKLVKLDADNDDTGFNNVRDVDTADADINEQMTEKSYPLPPTNSNSNSGQSLMANEEPSNNTTERPSILVNKRV